MWYNVSKSENEKKYKQIYKYYIIKPIKSGEGGILMGLTHGPLCKSCQKRRTTHPSGLCCDCRRVASTRVPCKICGKKMTSDPSGICARCRRTGDATIYDGDKLQTAIIKLTRQLTILKMRAAGNTFKEIGLTIGSDRSTCYALYCDAIHAIPNQNIVDLDYSVVPSGDITQGLDMDIASKEELQGIQMVPKEQLTRPGKYNRTKLEVDIPKEFEQLKDENDSDAPKKKGRYSTVPLSYDEKETVNRKQTTLRERKRPGPKKSAAKEKAETTAVEAPATKRKAKKNTK